ncbi:hypothetical protein CEXT_755611 [Caerostris extrusa]|uniref:Uncharacterized protein n=1 Tax=Caerostris extrusa TaxID=172846 RepID=A0AAV4RC47_CAEEX|nr:hypothetical protein CEXT_755611 [Caerostris extrusa]
MDCGTNFNIAHNRRGDILTHVKSLNINEAQKTEETYGLRKLIDTIISLGTNAVVCIKLLSEKFVITEDHAVRDGGSVLTVKRINSKLTPDAYPSIFLNQPGYLSSDRVSERKTPSE